MAVPMPTLGVTLFNTGLVTNRLQKIIKNCKEPDRVLAYLGSEFQLSMQENIKQGGGVDRWQGHSSGATANWPPVVGGGKPLHKTGRLMRSISYFVSGKTVRVGTNAFFAKVHQYGMTIRAKSFGVGRVVKGPRFSGPQLKVDRIEQGWLKFRIGDQWVQKRQVTIPARPFIILTLRAFNKIAPMLIEHIVRDMPLPSRPMRYGTFDDYRSKNEHRR